MSICSAHQEKQPGCRLCECEITSVPEPHPDPSLCYCLNWAYDHSRELIWRSMDLGTGAPVPLGHHPECGLYVQPPAAAPVLHGLAVLLPDEYPAAISALAQAYATAIKSSRRSGG